jgi:methylated-DNA-[protein]-cysteine S-methyltransferase
VRQEAKKIFKTSFGWAGVVVSEKGIVRIVLPRKERKAVQEELSHVGQGFSLASRNPEGWPYKRILTKAVKLLGQYFSGKSVLFDLPLDLRYYTPFQRAAWKACASIAFGETRSYGWIAQRINRPRASRAVGQAMGANPFPILIP